MRGFQFHPQFDFSAKTRLADKALNYIKFHLCDDGISQFFRSLALVVVEAIEGAHDKPQGFLCALRGQVRGEGGERGQHLRLHHALLDGGVVAPEVDGRHDDGAQERRATFPPHHGLHSRVLSLSEMTHYFVHIHAASHIL